MGGLRLPACPKVVQAPDGSPGLCRVTSWGRRNGVGAAGVPREGGNRATEDETDIRGLLAGTGAGGAGQGQGPVLANHCRDVAVFDVPLPLQKKGMAAYKATWKLLFFPYSKGGPGSFEVG